MVNDFDDAVETWPYLFENMLPAHRPSLVAGPSGAGKTSLMFQLINAWISHSDLFGYQSMNQEPKPHVHYVWGDQGRSEARETMARLNVPKTNFSWDAMNRAEALPEEFFRCPPDTGLLVIDCGERLVEHMRLNDHQAVSTCMLNLQKIAEERQMAILLALGSPKQKKGEEYLHARENITGANMWGRLSSCVFNLSIEKPDDPANMARLLKIVPRNKKTIHLRLMLNESGIFTPAPKAAKDGEKQQLSEGASGGLYLMNLFGAPNQAPLALGEWHSRATIIEAAKRISAASDSTIDRALAALVESKMLEKQHGKYQMPRVELPQYTT